MSCGVNSSGVGYRLCVALSHSSVTCGEVRVLCSTNDVPIGQRKTSYCSAETPADTLRMGASLLPVEVASLIANFEFKTAVAIKHSRVVPTGSSR